MRDGRAASACVSHMFDIDMSHCSNCDIGEPEIIAALVAPPVIEKALVRNEQAKAGRQIRGRISLPQLSWPAKHRHCRHSAGDGQHAATARRTLPE